MSNLEYSLPGLGVLTSKPKHVGHAGERELLLAFFELTGGKSPVPVADLKRLGREPKSMWRRTGGWDPAVAPAWHHEYVCAFAGVGLHEISGHVQSLKLRANGLVGALPGRMLKGLPHLEVLDLSDNDLRGGMPLELAFECFPGLTHLALSDNRHLGGGVPASLPRTCPQLVALQLHHAGLVGPLPPALLSLLPRLKVLVVHDNCLTGSSPLTLLSGEAVHGGETVGHDGHVDSTGLDKLAKALAVADASNKLKHKLANQRAKKANNGSAAASSARAGTRAGVGADDESGQMAAAAHHRSLVRLSGHGNRLRGPLGVLSAWLKLKLKDLTLGSNQFTGPVEPLFDRWVESNDGRCALQVLNLDRNLLSGRFPRTLSCVRFSLTQLNLSHNQLGGRLEGCTLGQLAVLEKLVLSHNNFTGPLPDQLSALATSLQQLVVSHNNLTGPMPCGALSHLTKLRTLDLQRNRLEGPVAPFFAKMTDLRELNLGFNELEGPMPLAALATFQRAQTPERRLKVLVLQPNPRMVQPSAEDVAALARALPCTNAAVAWKNYTF